MSGESSPLLQGTLDLLILKTLATGRMHGFGISVRIEQITGGVVRVKPGSLFPSLKRLEQDGHVAGEWGQSDNNRRARYYRLTPAGRRQLEQRKKAWERMSVAITRVLEAT